MPITFQRYGPEIADRIDEVLSLFAEVFAEPPYNEGPEHVEQFRRAFKKETKKPGFTFIGAEDGVLVGMAYGYTMPPDEWWRRATVEPPEEIKAAPKFTVMEWAVRPDYRGQGIGNRLMDELLVDRAEPWATLNANPEAKARDLYVAAGWEQLGRVENKLFPDMDVLILDLSERS